MLNSYVSLLEWYWKLWVLPWAYRIGAVFLGGLSVIIVWCEMTFGIYINPTVRISVLAAIIHVLDSYGNYIAVEVSVGKSLIHVSRYLIKEYEKLLITTDTHSVVVVCQ